MNVVIYERAEDGSWGAWVPDIDGVVAAGDTRDEVEALMREALPAHKGHAGERRDGTRTPEPRGVHRRLTRLAGRHPPFSADRAPPADRYLTSVNEWVLVPSAFTGDTITWPRIPW